MDTRDKDVDEAPTMWVLVVDDDAAIRGALKWVLEDAGYRVTEARDGRQALRWLRACPERAVVLLDLMMPELDGVGVLAAIARDECLAERHAYVMITAAQTLPKGLDTILSQLDIPVISKPFDIDALLDIVADAGRRLWAA